MLSCILQVELPILVPGIVTVVDIKQSQAQDVRSPEVVIVHGVERGVAQPGEDPLGVAASHHGVRVGATQLSCQQLRPSHHDGLY